MLNFIYEWGAFWEYKEPLAVVVFFVLVFIMSLIIRITENWRVKRGRL